VQAGRHNPRGGQHWHNWKALASQHWRNWKASKHTKLVMSLDFAVTSGLRIPVASIRRPQVWLAKGHRLAPKIVEACGGTQGPCAPRSLQTPVSYRIEAMRGQSTEAPADSYSRGRLVWGLDSLSRGCLSPEDEWGGRPGLAQSASPVWLAQVGLSTTTWEKLQLATV